MEFIEITDEDALPLPADQLMAIAVYNMLCLNATFEQSEQNDPGITQEHINNQYQKLIQQVKGKSGKYQARTWSLSVSFFSSASSSQV